MLTTDEKKNADQYNTDNKFFLGNLRFFFRMITTNTHNNDNYIILEIILNEGWSIFDTC